MKQPSSRRTYILTVRMSPTELRALTRRKRRTETISQYVRRELLGRADAAKDKAAA